MNESSGTLDSDLLDCGMAIEDDPFVAALKSLCEREGGYKAVAERANLSAPNLWQIISGVKLPSGNPRGVGPGIRKALNAAFPGWLGQQSLAQDQPLMPLVAEPTIPATALPEPPEVQAIEEPLLTAVTMLSEAIDCAEPAIIAKLRPLFSMLLDRADERAFDAGTIAQRVAELLTPGSSPSATPVPSGIRSDHRGAFLDMNQKKESADGASGTDEERERQLSLHRSIGKSSGES